MMGDWQNQFTPEHEIRFWNKVLTGSEDECWLWFAPARRGYPPRERGEFNVQGTMVYSHRVAWFLANGRIPEGMAVLHNCDITLCCNPKHLTLGTQQENMADAAARGRIRGGNQRMFSTEQILDMRAMYRANPTRKITGKIAAKYNADPKTIRPILNYKTYKDIP